ncbi:FkbM family methyltransferase [Polynucleobacter paneuropaeus]|jgi:FkbM family methyltransferase|nr:FkbM family methyltransferase [Polynucleobacter paneuropaeus]MBT8576693.1 FkbM family methyltransferase [Polynucleobacter paneuropaeus]MBT8615086.1 FkbM family methyltransferase [Polynucleobacter paneuropaeus]MBT8616567.1 FkbM family methyltransferase [Polynucleobacter paneuropaeus]MBT8618448.1 FkbM family methyltransferase [Polynucleobacter paneuropaeus]
MNKLFNVLKFTLTHPLNKNRKIQAFITLLRWQVGSRLLSCEIVYPWISGIKVLTRAGETGFTGNIYAGLHEHQEMLFCLHLLGVNDLFVDVGANIGSYSLLVSKICGSQCIAFEPSDDTFKRLTANIQKNNLQNLVTTYKCALGNEVGVKKFTKNFDTVNHLVADDELINEYIEVEMSTIDLMMAEKKPSAMKIDVEGYETLVVEGANNVLRSPKMNVVIMELNGSGVRYGFDETALLNKMIGYGFKPYVYNPFTRKLIHLNGKTQNGNTIFIKNLNAVEQAISMSKPILINGNLI